MTKQSKHAGPAAVAEDGVPEWTWKYVRAALPEGWGLDESCQIVRDDDAEVFPATTQRPSMSSARPWRAPKCTLSHWHRRAANSSRKFSLNQGSTHDEFHSPEIRARWRKVRAVRLARSLSKDVIPSSSVREIAATLPEVFQLCAGDLPARDSPGGTR
jgi:hypothetical protein